METWERLSVRSHRDRRIGIAGGVEMQVRGPGNIGGVNPVSRVDLSRLKAAQGTSQVSGKDSVEISELARLLDCLSRVPDIRQDKVNTVKAEIESGVYETADKLEKAIDALLSEL